jgi:predicted HAD superfamily Cof-like phosphohydrolase
MKKAQNRVRAFKKLMGQPSRETPGFPDDKQMELGLNLILEEYQELAHALGYRIVWNHTRQMHTVKQTNGERDIIEAADGIGDVQFTTFWLSDALGIQAEPIFNAIADNNMTKVGGPVCERTGKQLKPLDYVKVGLCPLIQAQMK